MKIIILASNPNLYSNKRILEAAKNRGHDIEFVDVATCHIKVCSSGSEIFYNEGKRLEKVDFVIPRIKPAMTFYATAIVRQFELKGISCLNGSEAIKKSRDKLHSLQLLSEQGLQIPTTSFAHSSDNTKDLISLVGGAPLVVKLLQGTKGVGVVLAETAKAADSVINAFKSLKAEILAQQYVKESKGQDIRCFVIGNKVVASIKRQAQEGEFRANIHLGATAHALEITDEERKMAIKAAKVIGLVVAGVDMVRSNSGPKILEINSSPGFEGVESVIDIDIAGKMIEFLEKKIRREPI